VRAKKGTNIRFSYIQILKDWSRPCLPCERYRTCLFNREACEWRRDLEGAENMTNCDYKGDLSADNYGPPMIRCNFSSSYVRLSKCRDCEREKAEYYAKMGGE